MFIFMSVVVAVWWSVGMFVMALLVMNTSINFLKYFKYVVFIYLFIYLLCIHMNHMV